MPIWNKMLLINKLLLILFVFLIVGLVVWLILQRVIRRWKERSLVWCEGRCSVCSQVLKGQTSSFYVCQVVGEGPSPRGGSIPFTREFITTYKILERATGILCSPCAKELCKIHAWGYAKWCLIWLSVLVCSILGIVFVSTKNDAWVIFLSGYIIAFVLKRKGDVDENSDFTWLANGTDRSEVTYERDRC